MYSYTGFAVILLGGIIYYISAIVFPPRNFPKNIPTIPFYVSFLGFFSKLDQTEIYQLHLRKHLEEHGAVKIYFASRWNILVTRPEYLIELFKKENIYAKSGNQIKIPYSVLSQYTGDNIISAHGKDWKLYRSVIAHNIQFPDNSPIKLNIEKVMNIVHSKSDKLINVGDLFQRFTLANVGQAILGVDLDALSIHSEMHKNVMYVKLQIFKPLYMNFPILDKLPIPSRLKAKSEVKKFREYFISKITTEFANYSAAGKRLLDAYDSGELTLKQFQDNAIIIMVAGHENPLLLILSVFYCIVKYPELQQRLRLEINNDNEEKPFLDSFVYETLRMYPPLGQIINRCTKERVQLGNIKIPKGTYVGYNNYGTGRDRTVWGSDADVFNPDRWGTGLQDITMRYKTAKRTGALPAFHGGNRACLGEKFALLETKLLVIEIIKNYKLSIDPNWTERFTPAGPICPVGMKIKFEKL